MRLTRVLRSLSLQESRFLGEHLGMGPFETLLRESPSAFLNSLTKHFRKNVPYSIIPGTAIFQETGKVKLRDKGLVKRINRRSVNCSFFSLEVHEKLQKL